MFSPLPHNYSGNLIFFFICFLLSFSFHFLLHSSYQIIPDLSNISLEVNLSALADISQTVSSGLTILKQSLLFHLNFSLVQDEIKKDVTTFDIQELHDNLSSLSQDDLKGVSFCSIWLYTVERKIFC